MTAEAVSIDTAYLDATGQMDLLNRGQISAAALTEGAIRRIEALDGTINAVVVRDFDRARVAAKAADAARAKGAVAPLLGLPMTIKDSFSLTGLPTSWGDPAMAQWMPPHTSLCVERLIAAGAIILGKTNTPLRMGDLQSFNAIHGTTSNPWDAARTCGGSSGGSAAALAAGYVAMELGSDFAGSLRIPAHFCGIYAHRPSIDLVPTRGGGPPKAPALPERGDFSAYGPMARSARDLMLGLDVLAGPDPLTDGKAYRLTLPAPRHDRLRDYRVLMLTDHPLYPTSHAVRAACETLAQRLTREGCVVTRTSPLMPDLEMLTITHMELLGAFLSEAAPRTMAEEISAYVGQPQPQASPLHVARMRGLVMAHRDWQATRRRRAALTEQWRLLMQDFDIVLTPVSPTAAIPHDQHRTFLQDLKPDRIAHQIDVDGRPMNYDDQMVWASASVLLGIPATAMPAGLSPEGLPVGVQAMGGYLEDRTTIRFAQLVEQAMGGFVMPTPLRPG